MLSLSIPNDEMFLARNTLFFSNGALCTLALLKPSTGSRIGSPLDVNCNFRFAVTHQISKLLGQAKHCTEC